MKKTATASDLNNTYGVRAFDLFFSFYFFLFLILVFRMRKLITCARADTGLFIIYATDDMYRIYISVKRLYNV